MRNKRDFRRDRRGATAIEYGLILALIGIAMAGSLSRVSAGLGITFDTIGSSLSK